MMGARAKGSPPQGGLLRPDWGFPMSTELQIVIMSIVALHAAALAGGGLALAVMRLFGRKPGEVGATDAGDSVH